MFKKNNLISKFLLFGLVILYSCSDYYSQNNPDTNFNDSNLKITNLNDSFTKKKELIMDWGYSSLIEFKGKKILFDIGNDASIVKKNIEKLGVDLKDIDFVILSHRHGDHMGGMDYLLSKNPNVKIYAPSENFGVYGASLPSSFYKKDPEAPDYMQYYNGSPQETLKFGKAWSKANIVLVDKTQEILPGFHLIFLVSEFKGTLELSEISLAIESPNGNNIVIGCGHTGVERILDESLKINPNTNFITGGFHLLQKEDDELSRIVNRMKNEYKVNYVAPSHCSGERAMKTFKEIYKNNYIYAGLGEELKIKTK
jgi:7,8-dihydropterin-6-yl-methyl-4-(beta-D-ribofuranosyl)aminobenzene 5'-phosphate synthase